MAESKLNATFDGVTFTAARPEVLPFLTGAGGGPGWGMYADFYGSRDELIAAGLATPDMFENIGKSGQKTCPTAFGDKYRIKRRRGKWDLSLSSRDEPMVGDPISSEIDRKCKWWREHGPEIEAITAAIIARFAKPLG